MRTRFTYKLFFTLRPIETNIWTFYSKTATYFLRLPRRPSAFLRKQEGGLLAMTGIWKPENSVNLWNLWLIFNQKRWYLTTKIEIFKKFLTAFITSSYEIRASRIKDFFRIKYADSSNSRGPCFSPPGRKAVKFCHLSSVVWLLSSDFCHLSRVNY